MVRNPCWVPAWEVPWVSLGRLVWRFGGKPSRLGAYTPTRGALPNSKRTHSRSEPHSSTRNLLCNFWLSLLRLCVVHKGTLICNSRLQTLPGWLFPNMWYVWAHLWAQESPTSQKLLNLRLTFKAQSLNTLSQQEGLNSQIVNATGPQAWQHIKQLVFER